MITIRIIVTLILIFISQTDIEINVSIENIKSSEGLLKICLFDNPDTFLSKALECREIKQPDTQGEVVQFRVQTGTEIAINVYHDLNANGRLDRNFLGIPNEPYGFSNNPSTRFGPPDFSRASFEPKEQMKIRIRL